MSDLVEQLRGTQEWVGFPAVPICIEAADEIERLRAALRAMHEEFASNFPDGERAAVDAARAALKKD
jgi:hypothetical protein